MSTLIDPKLIEQATIRNILHKLGYGFAQLTLGGGTILVHQNQICAIRLVEGSSPQTFEFFRVRYDISLLAPGEQIIFLRRNQSPLAKDYQKVFSWCTLFQYEANLGKFAQAPKVDLPIPVTNGASHPHSSQTEPLPPRLKNESKYQYKQRLTRLKLR